MKTTLLRLAAALLLVGVIAGCADLGVSPSGYANPDTPIYDPMNSD